MEAEDFFLILRVNVENTNEMYLNGDCTTGGRRNAIGRKEKEYKHQGNANTVTKTVPFSYT